MASDPYVGDKEVSIILVTNKKESKNPLQKSKFVLIRLNSELIRYVAVKSRGLVRGINSAPVHHEGIHDTMRNHMKSTVGF